MTQARIKTLVLVLAAGLLPVFSAASESRFSSLSSGFSQAEEFARSAKIVRIAGKFSAPRSSYATQDDPSRPVEFQYEQDHCASKKTGSHSGDSGAWLGTSAWGESGDCLPYSVGALLKASKAANVMLWGGVTKEPEFREMPSQGVLSRVHADYEARHYDGIGPFKSCHTAQWPMEWSWRLVQGTPEIPREIVIKFRRAAGGNDDGGYIKRMSGKIELLWISERETSVHMRFEIAAPNQNAQGAANTVRDYFQKISAQVAGRKLPGPIPDANCPYRR